MLTGKLALGTDEHGSFESGKLDLRVEVAGVTTSPLGE
jgi:hypothetical protein